MSKRAYKKRELEGRLCDCGRPGVILINGGKDVECVRCRALENLRALESNKTPRNGSDYDVLWSLGYTYNLNQI